MNIPEGNATYSETSVCSALHRPKEMRDRAEKHALEPRFSAAVRGSATRENSEIATEDL